MIILSNYDGVPCGECGAIRATMVDYEGALVCEGCMGYLDEELEEMDLVDDMDDMEGAD